VRLLFDQNIPAPLRRLLPQYDIKLAAEFSWQELVNGDLLAAAERAGFDVLLTADQNLRYQQNLICRKIGIVVLPSNAWPHIEPHVPLIEAAIGRAADGSYEELDWPWPSLVRRPPPDLR
jgi:hypothetical protein